MQITNLRIEHYKSFLESEEIQFSPGFNVIVGENNSGKTTLLEALSLRFENKPHQSINTLPYEGATIRNRSSNVYVSFYLEKDELRNLLADYIPEFFMPYDGSGDQVDSTIDKFISWFDKDRKLYCRFSNSALQKATLNDFEQDFSRSPTLRFTISRYDNYPKYKEQAGKREPNSVLAWHLGKHLQQRVYAFRAERFHVGQCSFGENRILAPDASNLPEVLNNLQSNYATFNRYNELVRAVFPQVTRVSVRAIPDNKVKIFVLTHPEVEKDYLALPLQDSGTGIGQVLAILYVVTTALHPQIILVDEPQSFLHPGAIRRLFEILKLYPQHQYIISTHSPTVIASANPNTIVLVKKEKAQSHLTLIDKSKASQLGVVLKEIGVSLSDVFGADNVLWVEGATEQICLPHVWSKLVKRPLLGTVILGVLGLGDFDSHKQSERAFQIYNRLSKGQSLIPPAIGFIFDKEERSQEDQDDLIRRSQQENGQQTVFFTLRKMYENYLLNPLAIAAILANLKDPQETSISVEEIKSWLTEHAWDKEFFKPGKMPTDRTPDNWLIKVHGKRVLIAVFREFLIGVEYREVEHGEALTKWLLENEPDELREIAELLKTALHMEKNEDGQH